MNQDELNSYNSGLTVASDGSAFGNSAEYDRQRQREICQSLSSSSQNSTSPTGGSFSSGSGTTIMDGLDDFLPFLDDWIFRVPTKIKIVTAIIGAIIGVIFVASPSIENWELGALTVFSVFAGWIFIPALVFTVKITLYMLYVAFWFAVLGAGLYGLYYVIEWLME